MDSVDSDEEVQQASALSTIRGGLTLWALGQCPGAHHFRGPTLTVHVYLKSARIAAKTALARVPEGVSVHPWMWSPHSPSPSYLRPGLIPDLSAFQILQHTGKIYC